VERWRIGGLPQFMAGNWEHAIIRQTFVSGNNAWMGGHTTPIWIVLPGENDGEPKRDQKWIRPPNGKKN
jgi:hypothetical protein